MFRFGVCGARKGPKDGSARTADEAEQQDEKEIARQNLVRVKTQFLRNMSHRIDTDVVHRLTNSSAKFRDISDKTSIPDFVKTVFDVGEEYGEMLRNVLKYYDSVNGSFSVVEGPMLIRNIVSDAKTDAKMQMMRVSSIPSLINVEISHDVPISEMIGDGPVIKACLQELIFNALRHDHHTHASVHVFAMSHSPCLVTFTVENQGLEIEDDDLLHIFTPFHNIHRGVVHGSGLGLGLARCKRLAHELGGDLHASNGPITTFSLVIPMKHVGPIRLQRDGISLKYERRQSDLGIESEVNEESFVFRQERISPTAVRPSILVVDDSAVARKQFERMMKHVDIDVDLCEGPLKCLDMVKGKTYDLICLDIIMPVMSGITCAHHLREGETINKGCPIVIITADNSSETRKLCACIPGSMVLEKPAKRNVLYRTIMSSLRDSSKKEWIRQEWHKQHPET